MDIDMPKKIWKLTIRPQGHNEEYDNSFDFCHSNSIIGIGWSLIDKNISHKNAPDLFKREYPKVRPTAFNILHNRISVNDFVWIYRTGQYYICQVTGEWEHKVGSEWDNYDIHNIRTAEWHEVPSYLVPGVVKRSMTMLGTAKKIHCGKGTLKYCSWLFEQNKFNKDNLIKDFDITLLKESLSNLKLKDIMENLDTNETEDIVGFYLQKEHGWIMVKSSTYKSRESIECEFQRVSNNMPEVAYMQVKSGQVQLDLNNKVYLGYASEGVYIYYSQLQKYHITI